MFLKVLGSVTTSTQDEDVALKLIIISLTEVHNVAD